MFYSNLKSICDKKGVKITPLVLECGGTKGIIGGWKRGTSPNSDIVMKIAIKLNVSTDVLLFGEEHHNCTNISNSNVGAIGDNSNGTVMINNNSTMTESKSEPNIQSKQTMSDITKEIVKISESLPMKEQVKLLSLIYDFEEKCRKSST